MSAAKRSCLGMAHGAITARLGCPPTTIDSLSAALSSTTKSEAPDWGFGPIGMSRSKSYADVVLASAPTRSEGVSGIQGTFVFHTNRFSGAQTRMYHVRMIIVLILVPSAEETTPTNHVASKLRLVAAVSVQFCARCVDQSSGDFDAPFSELEIARALAQGLESATGRDGLPHSAFQVNLACLVAADDA